MLSARRLPGTVPVHAHSSDPREDRIREALALRRWALPALTGAGEPAPAVSEGGWSTFLSVERCGLALLPLGPAVLGSGAAIVRRRAAAESQRVLSAAAQLRRIAKLARNDGRGGVVVLKGGVPLAEGRPGMDVVDVDVLAPPAEAQALGAALDATGFVARGRASSHRLAERMEAAAVTVEIHTGVPGIAGAEEFMSRARATSVAGLRAPHPEDHLWHLLLHGVTQHAGRRGNLRELSVLVDALGRCTPEDVARVQARVEARNDASALRAHLSLAEELRARRVGEGDPFRDVAAVAYTLVEYLAPVRLHGALKFAVWETTFLTLARRAGTGPIPEGTGMLRQVVRRMPEWALTPPALLLARRARRIAANSP